MELKGRNEEIKERTKEGREGGRKGGKIRSAGRSTDERKGREYGWRANRDGKGKGRSGGRRAEINQVKNGRTKKKRKMERTIRGRNEGINGEKNIDK